LRGWGEVLILKRKKFIKGPDNDVALKREESKERRCTSVRDQREAGGCTEQGKTVARKSGGVVRESRSLSVPGRRPRRKNLVDRSRGR